MSGPLKTIIISLVVFFSITVVTRAQTPPREMAAEWRIRQRATKTVIPEFPQDAILAKAEGVVYSIVLFNDKGIATEVEIVEAPHPSIAEAVVAALKQWEVKTIEIRGQTAELYGEVRFRYTIINSVGKVDALPDAEQKRTSDQYIKRRREIIRKQRKELSL